jgi:hypothetical protein
LPPPLNTDNAHANSIAAATAAVAATHHKDKDNTFNYLVVSEEDDDDETLDVHSNSNINRRKERQESQVQIASSSAEREDEVRPRSLLELAEQPQPPAAAGTSPDTAALKAVPKMMKVINRIKYQVHKTQEAAHLQGKLAPAPTPAPAPVPETVIPIPAETTPVPVPAVVMPPQKQYFNGARIHPTLLELYEITDHVLGVGTFATVREIRLKSSGQSFALKIILKKTLQGMLALLSSHESTFLPFFFAAISSFQYQILINVRTCKIMRLRKGSDAGYRDLGAVKSTPPKLRLASRDV